MKVGTKHYRTIWLAADGRTVEIIDQTLLPHAFERIVLRDAARHDEAVQMFDLAIARGIVTPRQAVLTGCQ